MAGGTGGHVFPALAVADACATPGWDVVWLGSRDGMEATLVPKHGYDDRNGSASRACAAKASCAWRCCRSIC